jgi:hypothetical protein
VPAKYETPSSTPSTTKKNMSHRCLYEMPASYILPLGTTDLFKGDTPFGVHILTNRAHMESKFNKVLTGHFLSSFMWLCWKFASYYLGMHMIQEYWRHLSLRLTERLGESWGLGWQWSFFLGRESITEMVEAGGWMRGFCRSLGICFVLWPMGCFL